MIKCIATDMDGTLLNGQQQISEQNRQAILKAQAHGIEVVVATGRSYQEATYALNAADLNCPVICVNGAEVRSKEGELIAANPIDKDIARDAAALLCERDVYFEVYTNEGAYSIDPERAVSILVDIIVSANPELDRDEVAKAAEARVRDGLIHEIADYELLFGSEHHQIYKLLAFSFNLTRLDKAGKALAAFEQLTISKSGSENLEITSKNAQKGIALEAFARAKGIHLAETMAIGDNLNDLSMLERAGKSVAMGNASESIKSLCDETTDTNENHGVAGAILKVLS